MFFISIVVYASAVIAGYLWIKKKLKLSDNSDSPMYTHINRFHLIGEIIIVAVSLIAIFYMRFMMEWRLSAYHDFILILAVLYAFRSVAEKYFKKDSKQYLLSAYASVSGLLLFLGLELFVNSNHI